jgi:hypothetical protein
MEEKTKQEEAKQAPKYPPQEIRVFPSESSVRKAKEEGYNHLRDRLRVSTPQEVITNTDKDKDTEKFIRFIREISTSDEAKQQEILGRIKGKGDEELLGVVSEIVHGLDVDAQVALTQGQQLAAERQAQVQMATQTEQKKSIWEKVKSKLWTQKAA